MARVAIVTGSDSGIGKATAVELARAGYDVGITWHADEDGANGTAAEVRQLNRRAEVRHVAPGEIATPMTGNEDVDPRTVEREGIPAGRPGDAREIASLIVWLASDGAAYATGSTFVVDGGLLLMAAERNDD